MDSSSRHQSIPTIPNPTFFVTEPAEKQLNRGFSVPALASPKRGYKKPSKPREFAKSARKRQSVLALDIETDSDVLLANCHAEIQKMLEAWCMVTGEVKAEEDQVPVDILAAIESTTKTIQSVKNYSMYKEDLSDDALIKVRAVALEVLEMISELEKEHRDDDTDDSSSEDGHIYKESNYQSLDKQRAVLRKYLQVVGDCLLFEDHESYQDVSHLGISTEEDKQDKSMASITPPLSPGHPNRDWVDPEAFGGNTISRYRAFLEAHRPSKSKQAADYSPLPDPVDNKAEFLAALAYAFSVLNLIFQIRRSKRPFGFIDKIHEDTSRTYRATENLKFFAAAVKFRFDIKFDQFNVTEVVKQTDTGKIHLEKALEIFCEKAMRELISTGSYKQVPLSRASSIYLQETLSSSQIRLQAAVAKLSASDDLASEVKEKLFIQKSGDEDSS
ncbi:15091_t:CDS:2 [Acaulospora colombiana]|uniref:15091_t:CDS:1 n=1 Tax=Acaulospora colombiana TaxID=27376 RepID=A0ACA9KQX4_9GLOM|nr:15091_t:CDS:2 [Acaulospora colombiana]